VRASRRESADPLDLAILERGGDAADDIVATFPFAENRRRETSIRRNGLGLVASVKGAPETVLALTRLSDEEKALWIGRVEELAASAHKVIACAELRLENWSGEEPTGDYMFAGLLAFEDPLREGAVEAVADARAAGIRVIVVTGDHAATARAIAHALNLGGGAPVIIDGDALARRLESGGADAVLGFDVVARATPAQKHALVQRLREAGEIVAVTGDGVNDAPALRAADIGIAMGQRGAQTSREVAAPSIGQCHASFECRLHETRITRDYPLFVWKVLHARVASSPKRPRTVHYRGEGRFMVSGDEVSRRRLFRPGMLAQ